MNSPRQRINRGRVDRIRRQVSSAGAAPIPMPQGLVFYCKSCQKILDLKPQNFGFTVPKDLCGATPESPTEPGERPRARECEVVYGTERSIKQYYKISDAKYDLERKEAEEKARRAEKL